MIDARRLHIFREVARCGTISGAAQALWMTQPAVSRQIAALERETGTQLFSRAARGVSLTEAGRVVLDHADAIAGHLAAAEAKLGDLAELRTGRLRIGTFPTAGATVLLDALTASTNSTRVSIYASSRPPRARASPACAPASSIWRSSSTATRPRASATTASSASTCSARRCASRCPPATPKHRPSGFG